MKIQSLLFLGMASFALAHANAQVDNGGYGFTEERGAATQSSGAVEPTFELLRTSYVAPASPSASALAPTAAGAPMILTPVVPAATPASTKSGCASACNAMFKPVCGSDGKTYSNSCMLSIAQCKNPDAKIMQKAEGACATGSTTPASTPAATTPGGSGSTLPTTAPVGETTPAPTQSTEQPAPGTPGPSESKCTQMCSSDFTPLCGSDGKTYSNACALSVAQCKSPSANLAKVADGECASGSSDSTTPAPATPVTTPETPAPAPSPASEAPAPAPPATCTQTCTFDIAPVCGSDGKTYSNACALSVAQCKSPSANLAKVADGECASGSSGSATPVPENPAPASEAPAPATPAKCEKMCTADYKPVCGSNGKTYSNACMLSIAQCGSPSVSITKASDGECSSGGGTTPASGTPATETPATLAAGGTSTPAPVSAPSVTKPAKGNTSKCEMACAKSYAPVCGSNGKTYNNVCLLRLANCKSGSKKTITIKSQGACSKGSSGSDTAKPSGSSGVIQAPAATGTSTSGGATSTTSTTTSTASGGSPSSPSSSTGTSATTSTSTSTSTTGTSTGTTGSVPGEKASYLRGNGAGNTNSPYQGQ